MGPVTPNDFSPCYPPPYGSWSPFSVHLSAFLGSEPHLCPYLSPFSVTASGPAADLAQAAAQGGSGAAGFQLPRPVRQGICSGVFEADEVGEGFWGATRPSVCSQDKTTPRKRAEHTACHV